LIRWVQAECKKLGDTDNPEVSDLLKKAVRCLKERPVLFKYCAEEVIMYLLHRKVTTYSNDI
jgi:conserved oligomeric Golgi complex subunit 6